MKVRTIGAGGASTSAAMIIKKRGEKGEWAEKMVISDHGRTGAKEAIKRIWNLRSVLSPERFGPSPVVERILQYESHAGLREMSSNYGDMVNEQKLLERRA